jgi:fermentation-respiration switch protein FrsA (DUF1100 family)
VIKFLLLIAGCWLVLVAFVYFTQAGMLYLPDLPGRQLDASPDDIGIEFEDVWLKANDGVKTHGWFVPGASSRTVLYFHGNAGNISHRLYTIQQLHELGLSVLIVDYRGYGQSEGKPLEKGIYKDAEAAWTYLTSVRGISSNDIVLFGRSLGASVAAWLAAKNAPAALIVDSAFTSVPDVAADVYPWLPVRLLSRFQHATGSYVVEADAPILVVHSRNDERINFCRCQ